jgi:hypothetical protein
MKNITISALALLAACNSADKAPQANKVAANTAVPDDRTPLAEPEGPIDPKSPEAAGQVVQHYGALIEQHRSEEAEKLWSDSVGASRMTGQLAPYPEIHLQIGTLGEPEGAAGSIYLTVPVEFYGKDQSGGPLRFAADVILRRVNDVPGSTEAQRRWHIERIERKKAR